MAVAKKKKNQCCINYIDLIDLCKLENKIINDYVPFLFAFCFDFRFDFFSICFRAFLFTALAKLPPITVIFVCFQ